MKTIKEIIQQHEKVLIQDINKKQQDLIRLLKIQVKKEERIKKLKEIFNNEI